MEPGTEEQARESLINYLELGNENTQTATLHKRCA